MPEKTNHNADSQPVAEAESAPRDFKNGTKHARMLRSAVPLLLALGCTPAPGPGYYTRPDFKASYPLNIIDPLTCSKETLLQYAEVSPKTILRGWKDCKDDPFMDEVIQKAAEAAAEKDPEAVMMYFIYTIIDKPYAHEVLMRAVDNAEDCFSFLLGTNDIGIIADQPYAEDLFFKLVDKVPNSMIYKLKNLKDEPYASKIIIKTIDNVENDILESFYLTSGFDEITDTPYAEKVFLKLAERIPKHVIQRSEGFRDKPYAPNVILRAEEMLKAKGEESEL